MSPARFGLGTPHGGPVPAVWERRVARLKAAGPIGTSWLDLHVSGAPHAEARTALVREGLAAGVDYLLFLDDDVLPPLFALAMLMEHRRADIVTGIYWSKNTVASQPVIFDDFGGGARTDWDPCSVFPVAAAGLGFCWISMRVFRALGEPWFTPREGAIGVPQGEDFAFFERAAHAGFRPLCDSRLLCQHLDRETGRTYPDDAELWRRYGDSEYYAAASYDPPERTSMTTPETFAKIPAATLAQLVKLSNEAELHRTRAIAAQSAMHAGIAEALAAADIPVNDGKVCFRCGHAWAGDGNCRACAAGSSTTTPAPAAKPAVRRPR